MTAAKPHLRLHYLGDGVWFADVYARRADAIPRMFTRFTPNVPAALCEASKLWRDWLVVSKAFRLAP